MEENNLYEKIEKAFTIDEKISNIIFQYLNTFIEKITEKHPNIEKTLRVFIIGSNLPVKIPVEPQYTPAKTLKQIKKKLKEKYGEKNIHLLPGRLQRTQIPRTRLHNKTLRPINLRTQNIHHN